MGSAAQLGGKDQISPLVEIEIPIHLGWSIPRSIWIKAKSAKVMNNGCAGQDQRRTYSGTMDSKPGTSARRPDT